MSWQLISFAILLAVLVGGFVWWERSRPPARLIALVAALAALAVAGRLVFAPIPNLVATTDIALLTGYALGGPPGFAVGALAAPISNIWLGQGPWTAWQMAAWGLVGLAGAGVAVVTARRLGRLGLAIVCGLAGLAYGVALDLSTMVTYGGEQSLDRYLALSSKAVPFNIVHATGNFVLAFAAGPALVRLISRYRTRLEFTWRPAAATTAVLALLAAVIPLLTQSFGDPPEADAKRSIRAGGVSSFADPAKADAKRSILPAFVPRAAGIPSAAAAAKAGGSALKWLIQTQNTDGGFAATAGQPSSPAMTGWVILGLEAAGRNPLDVSEEGRNPIDYLRAQADRLRAVGDLERTVLALVGAGLDPADFVGRDLVAQLAAKRDGDGSVDGQVNLTAFYVLAMRAAGADSSQVARSRRWLTRAQAADGGWGFQPGAVSDADSTGAALQAIAAAGQDGKPVAAAVRYLRRSQRRNGGFGLSTSGVVNSQSTAWALQGMVAAGAGGKPRRLALEYIESLRASDGHYRYSPASDQTPVWVTAQALLAVNRSAFPLAPVERAPTQAEDGGGSDSTSAAPEPSNTAPPATGPVVTPGSGGGGGGENAGAGGSTAAGGTDPAGGGSEAADGAESAGGPSAAEAAPATETIEAPSPLAADEAAGTPAEEDPDSSTLPYVIGGLTVLAAALAGGFVWYRNRLP